MSPRRHSLKFFAYSSGVVEHPVEEGQPENSGVVSVIRIADPLATEDPAFADRIFWLTSRHDQYWPDLEGTGEYRINARPPQQIGRPNNGGQFAP
jgi:hypothetical protein